MNFIHDLQHLIAPNDSQNMIQKFCELDSARPV